MKQIYLGLAGLLSAPGAMADRLPEVYPVPHQMVKVGEAFEVSTGQADWVGHEAADPVALAFAKKHFGQFDLDFTIGEIDDPGMDTFSKVPETAEGYYLSVKDGEVTVVGRDGSGTFYGLQTLSQLLQANDGKVTLPAVEVIDAPDVRFRGTVEGFYGKPWGFAGRASQLKFYGQYKLNTYIYGPKDDPFHGFSNRWREPYPEDKAKEMTKLVEIAKQNKVNFVWAVHPGADIHWVDKDGDGLIDDFLHCLNKFEMMYDLGVRSFAVFFDDIGGEGAKAEMQAKILNYLNREFVRKKPDVTPLIMCPTQYNKAWSGGNYLDILGNEMDKDIDIMWTGNSVCHDITYEGQEWINKRIKRKAYIWWNWPVSDYCRKSLLIGRTYGLDKKNKGNYGGLVSNPMDKPEASKIGLFGVADYCWNIDAFDSDKSWKDGIKRLFPAYSAEMQLFANHNSDQGKNFHGYRREESVDFKPTIDAALAELKANGQVTAATYEKLVAEFTAMEKAAPVILAGIKADNPALFEEIECWVEQFGTLGTTGLAAAELIGPKAKSATEKVALVNQMLAGFAAMDAIGEKQKVKGHPDPWATVCHTGAKHVVPFLQGILSEAGGAVYTALTGKAPSAAALNNLYGAFSNVPGMENITAERKGKYVHMQRILEVITLKPGQYIGLSLPPGIYANYIHVKLNNPKAAELGQIEVSKDQGQTWHKQNTQNNGEELHTGLNVKDQIQAMRYINTSQEDVEIKLNLFKFDIPEDAKVNAPESMFDGDLSSFYSVDSVNGELIANDSTPDAKQVFVVGSTDAVRVIYADGSTVTYDTAQQISNRVISGILVQPGQNVRIHEIMWK